MMVTEFHVPPDPPVSAQPDLTFPWKPVSLCCAGLTSGPVPTAPLRTSPSRLLLNPTPLKLEPKNNTEAIVRQ